MRRVAITALAVVALAAMLSAVAGADGSRDYRIEMFNAFGIVDGSEVRVAGVNAGTVTSLDVNEEKRAVVTVDIDTDLAELGADSECSSEPQSLIAEYFIDCDPKGEPLEEGGMIPATQVSQTVQPDLVQNTMREPFKVRFRLLLNEFGTALAGNPEDLNDAIRQGAPALREFEQAIAILAEQNELIRDLNVDSSQVIGELAAQRTEITRFVEEAGDTAEISASRRENVSRNFEILDDFLAELTPTLAQMDGTFSEQTPLLEDLRQAAPHLDRIARDLPPFNRAMEGSLRTLGEAAVVGERALTNGREEIRLLAEAGRRAPVTAEALADFVSDLDDPRRAVEIDQRVAEVSDRSATEPGREDTMGYTGFEGLLNYLYYQTLALNQFDQVSHLLHFSLYEVFTGPCGRFSTGRDPVGGTPGVPAKGGGTTTDIREVARCVGWLGANQPGINEDLNLAPYDPAVCPHGTSPERAVQTLCDPGGGGGAAASGAGERSGDGGQGGQGEGSAREINPSPLPGSVDQVRRQLEGLLGLPADVVEGLGGESGERDAARNGVPRAARDLLEFLFSP